MQYTKSMIDHILQIRKIAPANIRPQIKLANPDLLDELAKMYVDIQDIVIKDLIEQLMAMAGPAWQALLNNHSAPPVNYQQKTYRGNQTKSTPPGPLDSNSKRTSKVIYRGHVIHH